MSAVREREYHKTRSGENAVGEAMHDGIVSARRIASGHRCCMTANPKSSAVTISSILFGKANCGKRDVRAKCWNRDG